MLNELKYIIITWLVKLEARFKPEQNQSFYILNNSINCNQFNFKLLCLLRLHFVALRKLNAESTFVPMCLLINKEILEDTGFLIQHPSEEAAETLHIGLPPTCENVEPVHAPCRSVSSNENVGSLHKMHTSTQSINKVLFHLLN